MTTGEGDKTEKHSGGQNVAVWIAAAIVLYILSVGPACFVHDKSSSSGLKQVIETVYWPITWIYMNVPPLEAPLEWYADLWRNYP